MNHLDVDINISREEIARLGKTRPFWRFASFPVVLSDEAITWIASVTENPTAIGPKPKPIKIEVKETYISPFSGRVM